VDGLEIDQDFGETFTLIKFIVHKDLTVKFIVRNSCGEDSVEFGVAPIGE
jgi:hypothetical protein